MRLFLLPPPRRNKKKIALYLSRILNGMIHDVGNGVLVIVNH
ncbi:capping complex subunit for YIEGIA [Syntrophaceticus schinkii]